MSFFGSTKNLPSEPQRPFGARTERIATNESARVLPWFIGRRWLGVTWIGDVFGVRTSPIRRKVGKKKTTVGYNYYASFAGLICGGPVDRIVKIKFDDEIIWSGVIDRADDESVNITTSKGVFTLFWGTETQSLDSELEASGQEHSAYRGQCYIVGRNILLGADRTTVANLQVEMERFARDDGIVLEADRMVPVSGSVLSQRVPNPMSILVEWWTDKRFGMGRSVDELDAIRIRATATQLDTDKLGLCPILTSASEMKKLIVQLLENIDGYPTSYGGKFGVELIRPVVSAVPEITKADLIGDYTLESQDWPDTYDEVRVKFKDLVLDDIDNSVKHHERANHINAAHNRALNVERPWVSSAAVAQRIAGAIGRVMGVPQSEGSMTVRESRASALTVGSVFDLITRDGETLRMRVQERNEAEPDKRAVDIEFKSDSGWSNADTYTPEADVVAETPVFQPAEPDAVRILDSPYAIAETSRAALLHLVARGDGYSTEFDVWKASNTEGPYASASERRPLFQNFAVRAELSSSYDLTLPIDESVGISLSVTSPDQSLLEDEWDFAAGLNHELLCFFGSTGTEIASLFDVVKTGATSYTAKCVRGLYDTRRRAHASGTEIWIQLRAKIEADAWPPISENVRHYKFQPRFLTAEVELADLDHHSHTENGRTLLPICPSNVMVDGDSFHAIWTAGNPVTVSWLNTSRARTVFGLPFNDAPATDLTHMIFEVRSYDGTTLLDTFEEDAADELAIVTNGYLAATVDDDFCLRAYGSRGGNRSLDYTDVLVRKV